MVREDLITSAVRHSVSFLQDPSVATAPVDQRVAFLRSKNLTQDEIDLALQRAGSEAPSSSPPAQTQVAQYQRPPPQSYPQNAYWQQPPPPPPELPRRDWRDWFIMATVMGGLGYGAYFVAKRYIYPLIAPPTPPQLEQDKAAVDASFDKAFALLDQLATDTSELKASEQARTEKLDTALSEVESVIGQLKDASRRRDDEGRRLNDEIRALKDMIPSAMESQKKSADQRLADLATEMKSLKTLISNRMAAPAPAPRPNPSAPTFTPATPSGASAPAATPAPDAATTDSAPAQPAENKSSLPDRSASSSPYGRPMGGRAAIPAWQMAASKKNQDAKEKSGTVENASTDNATA